MANSSAGAAANTPVWEQHKENAAPLERGRNVSVLEQSFQAATGDKEPLRRHYEARVRPYEGAAGRRRPLTEEEDPLIDWLSYIKFHQEAFPADRNGEFLLLERCFRSLAGQDRYREDVRFVRVCCLYAEATSRTQEVFQHLYRHKVGVGTAVFWAAWAFQAERDGDFKLANQILTKGMEKYQARPTQFLQQRYLQFQRRFVKHLAAQADAAALEPEEYEQGGTGGRGALGGLSQEAVRRNHRAQAALPSARTTSRTATYRDTSRTSSHRPQSNANIDENAALGGGAFAIYSDENNGGSALDDSFYAPGHGRHLERERDLRKENTMDAEPWNQRGGIGSNGTDYTSGSIVDYSHGHMQPSLSFSVHVDEECLVQHQREQTWRKNQEQQMRNHRDERAFQQREEGRSHMAELLVQDPLRYTRDPSLLETDNLGSAAAEGMANLKLQRKTGKAMGLLGQKPDSGQGYDRRLLTNELGAEQCFEEARARAGYYKVAPLCNINNFREKMAELEVSESDCDVSMEGDSLDQDALAKGPTTGQELNDVRPNGRQISTIDSPSFMHCVKDRTPRNASGLTVISEARPSLSSKKHCGKSSSIHDSRANRSYEQNTSFQSTASSGVDEEIAVGLPLGKEEQTINTALARKELSMMFGSPMLAPISEGFRYEDYSVGAALGNFAPSESFALNDSNHETSTKMKTSNMLKSAGTDIFSTRESAGENTERPPESEKLGFCIFEETSLEKSDKDSPKSGVQENTVGFAIYKDGESPYYGDNAETAPIELLADVLGLDSTHLVNNQKDDERENYQEIKASGFSIFRDESEKDDGADTAPTEMIANALSMCDTSNPSILNKSSVPQSCKMDRASIASDDETATLSDIAGLFSKATENGESHRFSHRDLSRIDENDVLATRTNLSTDEMTASILPGFGDVSGIAYVEDDVTLMLAGINLKNTSDYASVHAKEIKSSKQKLEALRKDHLPGSKSLAEVFASQGSVFSSPTDVIPRAFRHSALPKGTEIKVGRKSALVISELGRGSFGVVVSIGDTLLDSKDISMKVPVAVKVQRPTTCLALEFEILQKLQTRLQKQHHEAVGVCFPNVFAYIAVADGAMMSMTAGSLSGMSFVDLVNVYKIRQEGKVPSILALHFTARMLHHLELLHWHAKILHCDTKPDNWIISSSDIVSKGNPIMGAEIMLVDFGRAIDLESLAEETKSEVTEVLMTGNDWPDAMRCVSMRLGLPWSFDIDTFGVCATAHVLLFGEHMEMALNSNKRWMPAESLLDCEHHDLWSKIFDSLLNLDDVSKTPLGSHPNSVRRLRTEIEAHLSTRKGELVVALEGQAAMLQRS